MYPSAATDTQLAGKDWAGHYLAEIATNTENIGLKPDKKYFPPQQKPKILHFHGMGFSMIKDRRAHMLPVVLLF